MSNSHNYYINFDIIERPPRHLPERLEKEVKKHALCVVFGMDSIHCICDKEYNAVFCHIVHVPYVDIVEVVGRLVAGIIDTLRCAVGMRKCYRFNIIQETHNTGLLNDLSTCGRDVDKACISILIVFPASLPVVHLSIIRQAYKFIVVCVAFECAL